LEDFDFSDILDSDSPYYFRKNSRHRRIGTRLRRGHPVKIEDFPGLSPRPTAFLRKQEEGQREKFKRDRMKFKNKDKSLRSQSRQARSKYLFGVHPPQADLFRCSGALIGKGDFI